METQNNVPAIKNPNALAFVQDENFIESRDVSASDIRISRLLLAQKMSPIVDKADANIGAGDLYDSVTEACITKKGQIMTVIPLFLFKSLAVKWKVNGKFEFKESHDWKPEFAKLPWDFEEGGVEHKNIETINLFCLKKSDMGNQAALPIMISFRVTSLNCGKDIVADYLTTKQAKVNFSQMEIDLYTELVTKDNNAYYVFKKKMGRINPAYAENKSTLENWAKIVSDSSMIKVDTEEKEAGDVTTGGGEPFTGQF